MDRRTMGGIILPSYPCKIVTGSVMAEIDRQSINERGLSGLFLMEEAGRGIFRGLLSSFEHQTLLHCAILCGKGNNGGDGFVVARHLAMEGLYPRIALLGKLCDLKGDALTNAVMAEQAGISIAFCTDSESLHSFFDDAKDSQLWIDALLGTGARGAPRGLIAEAIRQKNLLSVHKQTVSVDIPSGVDADTGSVEGTAIYAEDVYTMGLPKVGHVVPPGQNHYRKLHVLDIGFPRDLLEDAKSDATLITAKQADVWYPRRLEETYKGQEGHLLVIAGSKGMTGAALMCAKAALVTGAGLITAVCPESLLPIYAGGLWEMMTLPVNETETGAIDESAFGQIISAQIPFSAVVIGPGLGRHPSTMAFVKQVLSEIDVPVLLDGDALFAITPDDLAARKDSWVITPHAGEMARLMNCSVDDVQANRWSYASKLAKAGDGIVVLKGPNTAIVDELGSLWINSTGTPAMASGGMGDVLSGMIGALLAKREFLLFAACSAVYLHGLSAQLIEEKTGAESVWATSVIDGIPQAIKWTRQQGAKLQENLKANL